MTTTTTNTTGTNAKPFTITVSDGRGAPVRQHRCASWASCRRKLLALRKGALFADWGWTARVTIGA